MKKLISKYRTNSLSSDDIRLTRELLGQMTDDELAHELQADWHSYEVEPGLASTEAEQAVWGRLAGDIISRRRNTWNTAVRIAAVAVIVVLTTVCAILYHDNYRLGAMEITTSTGAGERVTAFLPDGSSVDLNGNSTISYRVNSFGGGRRMVNFNGEGYFDISHRDAEEFIITTRRLHVTVHGTRFNLYTNENDSLSTLSLIEGSVSMTSLSNGEEVTLKPNEQAVLNHHTGCITVMTLDDNDNPTAWRELRLTFNGATLGEVIGQIEAYYRCRLSWDHGLHTERFTGAIPLDNLADAIDIVATTFHTAIEPL